MLSTRQGIFSVIVGTTISTFNAIIQFLTMYWVLEKFGTEFNGFIRLVTSFSAIIATAEGALGIAASILLVKPLVNNDWISANEIYSTAKKSFRRSAITSLALVTLTAIFYPLYAGVSANGNIFNPNSWKGIGLILTGAEKGFAPYWMLMFVALIFGTKNFVSAFWFSVYETIIIADNKNVIRRITILFSDILVSGLTFYLLATVENPILPFIPTLLYSPIKGLLIYMYVKKKYLWLKYYRDFNSFKLNTTTSKITWSNLGSTLLLNSDIAIASIILGLSVSSTLSLYLVVALNVRLIMTNFVVSFREFFVTLVAKRGRIGWESYTKYELYTYLIAAFTFINMSILSPYFVSALYAKNIVIDSADVWNRNAFEFMFYTPNFSILYGAITAFTILCDGQMTLIQAKGRYGEVSKFQNIIGIIYIIGAVLITFILVTSKVGGEYTLVVGIISMYTVKLVSLIIRYSYLWIYVWKYVTYNSTKKNVLNNFLILIIPIILSAILNVLFISKKLNIEKSTDPSAHIAPLIALFFTTIFVSMTLLILFSYILNAKAFNGIIRNLPIVQKIVTNRSSEQRKKRFEEYGIDVDGIVDKGNQISHAMYGIEDSSLNSEILNESTEISINPKSENIFVLKGK
ncbi:hypothetical protein [Spiroplasma diminutum]|uniref:Transmembrane protein n=1 Tax=Spiroplasma diminutum CUAS-1 TaxID=1276221 RepID=S5MDM2_9MOLU|nr:hypothetical protein [Spiroplasma diminutum]AGR41818.1 hypothetical protein SDIMI_v3c01140 [Spiroplasma diminutum CUAS-1]